MLVHDLYAGTRQALVSYGLSTLLLAITAVALYFGHWFFKLFRARSFYWGLVRRRCQSRPQLTFNR